MQEGDGKTAEMWRLQEGVLLLSAVPMKRLALSQARLQEARGARHFKHVGTFKLYGDLINIRSF